MKRIPLPKVSKKQSNELMLRKKLKAELMKEQLETVGFIRCVRCGQKPDFRGISMGHIISLARGGKTTKENCELLCFKCHSQRHGIHEVEELIKYWD